jgi:hypothetical protein
LIEVIKAVNFPGVAIKDAHALLTLVEQAEVALPKVASPSGEDQ